MAKIYLKKIKWSSNCEDLKHNKCYFDRDNECHAPNYLSCTKPSIIFIQVPAPKEK